MKILLINPVLGKWNPSLYLPLGLAYVASALESEGHAVEIIDMNAEKMNDLDLISKINTDVDAVGITGMITEYRKIINIITTVKQTRPELIVIVGGPLASTIPQKMLENTSADFIVIGEGERTTTALISAIECGSDLSNIRGIAFKKDDNIIITEPAIPIPDLDMISFPARHLLNLERYIQNFNFFEKHGFKFEGYDKIRCTNLISSRGCPYDCIFCFRDMWGYNWRGRSAENIFEEMKMLNSIYGINGFVFNDDTFVLNKKRIFELTDLIKKSGLDIVWCCNGRVNLMQKDMLKAMYDAGCRGIAYGIESGNQSILDSMKKKITLDQVRNAIEWTKEAGINVAGYFMIGILGETKETIRDTIHFAKELNLDFYSFTIQTPLPGTKLYEEAVKRGLVHRDMDSLKTFEFDTNINLTQDCSDDDLFAFKCEAFKEFSIKKQFGKYFLMNPTFLVKAGKAVLSLKGRNEAGDFFKVVRGIFK